MADEAQETPRPFDVQTIKFLVHLMSKHDLSELDLQEGTQRIRLRRGTRVVTTTAVPPLALQAAPAVSATPPPVPAAIPSSAPAEQKAASQLIEIKSPTVGTFYAQEKEGAAPYVTIGLRVTPTTIIGLIEAMKVFNEIFAGVSGVVKEIVVKNGEAVEYNQVLFRVDPTA